MAAARSAARWFSGRAACLENSLAVTLTALITRRSVDRCIGARLMPYAAHAWIETEEVTVGEPRELVRSGRRARFVARREVSSRWVGRTEDPDGWLAAVYADISLVPQVADGEVGLDARTATAKAPSSSSPVLSLVGQFLELLDPPPGDRVLEIGTGTGWTAGLLSK